MTIIGIDPGFTGAIVVVDEGTFKPYSMPLLVRGKQKDLDYRRVIEILEFHRPNHLFLERAVSFGMGTKSAFNYGRLFGMLEIAIETVGISHTYVEPAKWAKEMHAGITAELKSKFKSSIALERLFPEWLDQVPKSKKGVLHDGVIDALLIAEYGRRVLNGQTS